MCYKIVVTRKRNVYQDKIPANKYLKKASGFGHNQMNCTLEKNKLCLRFPPSPTHHLSGTTTVYNNMQGVQCLGGLT